MIVLFLALDYGMSGLVRSGWLHERFTRRLETAFGRPVEVSNYSFSLLEGPRLEANYITVGEDLRFGNEYFLRADQVAVGLRWTALLRGRIVLGTLSFTNPHLNLVRLPDGEWNLESWLPRPPRNISPALVTSRTTVRPERIEVSGGRVDFKAGADKSPFALVSVEGSVQQAAPGSWQMDLKAQPFRASVAVQQAGELRLTGLVGGTSSRLRPAMLHFDWSDASLQDVLRLARGTDYGMRGMLAFQLAARTEGPAWQFSSRTQLRHFHRWNLPLRADDPAANVNVDALWVPGRARLELSQAVVETPHSSIRATGGMVWEFDPNASRLAVKDTQLELFTSGVELGDLLAWYRAFHTGTAEQLALSGMAGVDVMIRGWPPRIEQGSVATEVATLSGASLPADVRLGHAAVMFSPRKIEIPFVTITSSDGAEAFRLQGILNRRTGAQSDWKIDGKSKNVHALFSSGAALGYNLPQGWSIDGPAQFQLEWKGARWPAVRRTQGTISLEGLKILAPFLNREITRVRGTVDLSPRDLKIQVASADAFAANWSGSVERKNSGAWQFSLAADALDAAEMDRWLNPQRRQGLFDRVFSFLNSPPQSAPVPAWLEGKGTLAVGQFTISPFVLRQVRADASLDGRKLELSNAQSDFYGGELRGTIHLDLTKQPSYRLNSQFRRVNLNQLAARTDSFVGLFEGTASGKLQISAEGLGRDALLHSISCRGEAQVSNAEYRGIDLTESLRREVGQPGISAFSRASADFVCENGNVHFSRLMLATLQGTLTATGDVDSQRRIDFEVQGPSPVPGRDFAAQPADPPKMFRLTGKLKAPNLAPVLTWPVPQ